MAATRKGGGGSKARGTASTRAGARTGGAKANSGRGSGKTSPKAATSGHGPAASKKAAPTKINDRQRELLVRIQAAGETGYQIGRKTEQRSIDALIERKLVKRGTKNKETGQYRYLLTRAGQKSLPAPSAAPAPAPAVATTEAATPTL